LGGGYIGSHDLYLTDSTFRRRQIVEPTILRPLEHPPSYAEKIVIHRQWAINFGQRDRSLLKASMQLSHSDAMHKYFGL
jgi:hypothetical protein